MLQPGASAGAANDKVGSLVAARKVFPYDDGSYSYKNWHVDWPKVGETYGFDASQFCGPVVGYVADNTVWARDAYKLCPFGQKHAWDAPCHKRPIMPDGKPFVANDHAVKMRSEGLAKRPQALAGAADDPNFVPPGRPKLVDGAKIYPRPPF